VSPIGLTRIKKDKPALRSLFVVHVGRQLRWPQNFFALYYFKFDQEKQSRRERHKHIHESDARYCLSDCGTFGRKFCPSKHTEEFLAKLFGPLLQPSLGSRFPERIYRLGFDCALELFEEFSDGNAGKSR
jgi:hypothetical protein